MRKQLLGTVLLIGWAIFAPHSWTGALYAQTTILNVSGALTTSSPKCPIRGNGNNFYEQRHTIAVNSGNQYVVDLRGTNSSGAYNNADTFMYLLGPNGAIVAENDDVILANDLRSRIAYNATSSGTYTVVVTTWAAGVTTAYQLTGTERGITGSITGTLVDPNFLNPKGSTYNAETHTVNLTANQAYLIDVIGTFWANGSGWNGADYAYNVDTYLYLLDSNGNKIAESNNYGNGYASQIAFTPTSSGAYTLLVTSGSAGQSFSYQVTVSTPQSANPSAPPPPPLAPGAGEGIPNVRLSPRLDRVGAGIQALG